MKNRMGVPRFGVPGLLEYELRYVREALRVHKTKADAARSLGIKRTTFFYEIKRLERGGHDLHASEPVPGVVLPVDLIDDLRSMAISAMREALHREGSKAAVARLWGVNRATLTDSMNNWGATGDPALWCTEMVARCAKEMAWR